MQNRLNASGRSKDAVVSRHRRVVIDISSSDDEDDIFHRSPTLEGRSQMVAAERGGRDRVIIDSSSSSDENEHLFQPPSMRERPRITTATRRDQAGRSQQQQQYDVSELELNLNAMRLNDPPSSRNGFASSVHSTAQRKVENDQVEDDEWVYDARLNEYTLARPPTETTSQWPILRIPKSLFDQLFDFQKTGVYWMAILHAKKIGGILGDDMGMGKTYTTLTFLGGLMKGGTIKNALIVAPVSVLRSWEKEAHKIVGSCISGVRICVVSSDIDKNRRIKLLREAHASLYQPHIVITTFGLVSSAPEEFKPVDNRNCCWDYFILDEAHTIRNPKARVGLHCKKIGADDRTRQLLLTGTPIMNRLNELWTLFDFVTKGQVLPELKLFKKQFSGPIEAARDKDASDGDIQRGERANKELQDLLKPFFLQRLKIDWLRDKLPLKRELVIWTHLSTKQRVLYQNYINFADTVASVLSGETSSPLVAITWLKKLAGHPLLVDKESDEVSAAVALTPPSRLVEQSAKLGVLVSLIDRLCQSGHRALIFSQSTRMLDIIQRVLCDIGVNLGRIDGTTKERERQRLVDDFNSNESAIDAMLLSTKAAGVGLTLTGADRAVIYDPSWNPAEDSQAVDRCYRIGQKSEVTVYRLIAAGTVEEKMYEKQVYKDGIRRAVTTNAGNEVERYFDRHELRKVFSLAPAGVCDVLSKLSSQGKQVPLGSSGKPTFLTDHEGVVGVSSHDGVYKDDVATAFDGSPLKGNPFEGTALASPKKVMGRSQRALTKPLNSDPPKPPASVLLMNSPRHLDDRALKISNRNPVTAASTPKKVADVGAMFRKADFLCNKGYLKRGMGVLLDILELADFTSDEKMELHQRIAKIADEIKWLH